MSAPWPADELAWAVECFAAGDTLEEIAQVAGRTVADVKAALGRDRNLTPLQREVLSLYAGGCDFADIDRERGFVGATPGKAASFLVTYLRRNGLPVPHRFPAIAATIERRRQDLAA